MYHVIDSRVGLYSLVLTLIRQFKAINQSPTAYRIAKALDCSVPTARKLLQEMETLGKLKSTHEDYRNTYRVVYSALVELGELTHASNSMTMLSYWSGKNAS